MCPPLHHGGRPNSTPPPPKPRGGLAALGGERREPIRLRRPSAHAPSVQGRSRVQNPGAAAGVGPRTSIAVQPKTPLLLGPGPGQRASKRRDGEAGRRRPVEEARDDSW